MKKHISTILKAIVSVTIINVWFFRLEKETIYRGGEAKNLMAEFAAYGLGEQTFYIVGTLKVLAAIFLLASIFYKRIQIPPIVVIGTLMVGAIYFHLSIGDQLIKILPATVMLSLCALIIILENQKQKGQYEA